MNTEIFNIYARKPYFGGVNCKNKLGKTHIHTHNSSSPSSFYVYKNTCNTHITQCTNWFWQ